MPALVAGIHDFHGLIAQRRGWPEQVRPWRGEWCYGFRARRLAAPRNDAARC